MWLKDKTIMLGRFSLLISLVAGLGVVTARGQEATPEAGAVEGSQPQVLRLVTTSLPDGVTTRPYRAQLQARGGREPYRWSLDTPGLPAGLALNESSGEIVGTAMEAPLFNVTVQLYDFTVRVADSSSPPQVDTRYFTLKMAQPLALETVSLPKGVHGFPYRVQLEARGGARPHQWEVVEGSLPPGIEFHAGSKLLTGTPAQAGEFQFTIQVTDAGNPAQTDRHTFVCNVLAPLAVDWRYPPRVEAGGIYGSVQVSNGTQEEIDLTLIVVAVNEFGRAFTLGYQKLALKKETVGREMLFGFRLPRGEYVVHADAVAEVAPKNALYRGRRQQGPLRVE